MLVSLRIMNFRGFSDHVVPLLPFTVIVGQNNAGKSTAIEALRLVAAVARRYRSPQFIRAPLWTGLGPSRRGVRPAKENLLLNSSNLFHHYGKPPALIEAKYSHGPKVAVYIGPEPDGEIFGQLFDEDDAPVETPSAARALKLSSISILPQVGPLQSEERLLDADYVRQCLNGPLAPRHFRNQLLLFRDQYYAQFKQNAEASWPGLQVHELERDEKVSLLVRDRDYVSEIAWMGHGLQMWLQTIWFLTRAAGDDTVILDEPDVYMHPDLQRRLIRLLELRHRQTIIATHSVEMMAHVEASNVVILNRSRPGSSVATGEKAVQQIIDRLGGVHNLQLARLWRARKCLLIEGKDLSLLKRLYKTLFPAEDEFLEDLPHFSLGGWGGLADAVGAAKLLRNGIDQNIITYCIFDSDFHTDKQIEERCRQAQQVGLQLHIWTRKELENYLLVPSCIARIIANKLALGKVAPTAVEVEQTLTGFCEGMKASLVERFGDEHLKDDRSGGFRGALRSAELRLDRAWQEVNGPLKVAPGKEILRHVSDWSHRNWGVNINANEIAARLKAEEIDGEMQCVLRCINQGQAFPVRTTPIWNCPSQERMSALR